MAQKVQLPDGRIVEMPADATVKEIETFVNEQGGGFSKPKGQTASQRESKRRIANMGVDTAKYDQETGDRAAETEFASKVAETLPYIAAVPLTGGMSALPAMATMAGVGATSGIMREETHAIGGGLSGEQPSKSKSDLAWSLGVDTISPVLLEGGVRAIASVGKTLLPQLMERAAAKSSKGEALLGQMYLKVKEGLTQVAGKKPVDVSKALTEAYESLDKIPKGVGKLAERFTGLSEEAARVVKDMEAKFVTTGGKISSHQPLDALIDMKGNLQRFAWDNPGLRGTEKPILQRLATRLDTVIKSEMKSLGPEAEALYARSTELMKTQVEKRTATSMAERAIKVFGPRALLGGAIGGKVGYQAGGSATSTAEGVIAGAGIAVAVPKLAALVLEQTMSHPQAAPMLGKAIDLALQGSKAEASTLAARAFKKSDAIETIKQAKEIYLTLKKDQEQQPDQP